MGLFILLLSTEHLKVRADFIKLIDNVMIEELWITSDVRPERGEEKWLNIILRKK